eukprot:4698731-Amphidinium_carterae.1
MHDLSFRITLQRVERATPSRIVQGHRLNGRMGWHADVDLQSTAPNHRLPKRPKRKRVVKEKCFMPFCTGLSKTEFAGGG